MHHGCGLSKESSHQYGKPVRQGSLSSSPSAALCLLFVDKWPSSWNVSSLVTITGLIYFLQKPLIEGIWLRGEYIRCKIYNHRLKGTTHASYFKIPKLGIQTHSQPKATSTCHA